MLYDNAQLLELLALAHAHRPDPLYAAARGGDRRLDGARHDRRTVAGRAAFAASEDADSEGEEGRFYVWTEAEVDALLGDASAAFKRAYDVTPSGNWEGHTILRRVTPAGIAGGGSRAGTVARDAVRGPRETRAARARRQGAGGLERPGDRRPGARRRGVRPARVAGARRGGARLHPGRDVGAGWAGAARLAARAGDGGGAARRSGRDGARIAGAVRGDRRGAAAGRGDPAGQSRRDGVRRRAGRLLHHRRRCDRRAAGAAAHRGRQRDAGGQWAAGRGVRPALAPDRR